MAITNPRLEEGLRQSFKSFNRFMMLWWRLGLGRWADRWPDVAGRIMVLVHTGRKTGARRYTPLNYAIVDGVVYCTAGFGGGSDWYRNILAQPQAEVWLPDGWWAVVAEEVPDGDARLPLMREVIRGSGIVGPLFGVDPRRMGDAELAAATTPYRLIRLRRTEARTGRGGPGELAWVWPLATLILLLLARPRRRTHVA